MRRQTVTVTFKAPKGFYCNRTLQKPTPLNRCRFCTDLRQGRYTCVLYNEPLAVTDGVQIDKAPQCLAKDGEVHDEPFVPTQDIIKFSLLEYRKVYTALIKQGVPEKLAHVTAMKEVMQ
jgi:hypothetical protein